MHNGRWTEELADILPVSRHLDEREFERCASRDHVVSRERVSTSQRTHDIPCVTGQPHADENIYLLGFLCWVHDLPELLQAPCKLGVSAKRLWHAHVLCVHV